MRRTITLDVMWQIDPHNTTAVEPTSDYRYGSPNCFATQGYIILVCGDDGTFVGHIDNDKTHGPAVHLGVYKGDPKEVAARLRADFRELWATRKDVPKEPQPAEMVVWLREFSDEGGPEIGATQLLYWSHPSIT